MKCVALAGRQPVYELSAADLVVRDLVRNNSPAFARHFKLLLLAPAGACVACGMAVGLVARDLVRLLRLEFSHVLACPCCHSRRRAGGLRPAGRVLELQVRPAAAEPLLAPLGPPCSTLTPVPLPRSIPAPQAQLSFVNIKQLFATEETVARSGGEGEEELESEEEQSDGSYVTTQVLDWP